MTIMTFDTPQPDLFNNQAQADRLEAGWDDAEAALIEAQYPELSDEDFYDASENVNESVMRDYDIKNDVTVMELYAASCEGIVGYTNES